MDILKFKVKNSELQRKDKKIISNQSEETAYIQIYLVSDSGSGKNQYKEFFWNDSASEPGYEQFGGVEIDVSKFIIKKQMTDYLANNSTLTLSADGELALNIVDATE